MGQYRGILVLLKCLNAIHVEILSTDLIRVERGLDTISEVIIPDQGVDLPPQPLVPVKSLVGVDFVLSDSKPLVVAEKGKCLLCTRHQVHLQCSIVNVMLSTYTVKPLLAATTNSGHLLYSGQCAMYQVRFPFIPYLRNLRIAATS